MKRLAAMAVVVTLASLTLVGCSPSLDAALDAGVTSADSKMACNQGSAEEPSQDATNSGVTPEFKKMMDEYEAFIDEYVAFMRSYNADPSSPESLERYSSYMAQYADTLAAIEAVDQECLSEADAVYYAEVVARVSSKLLSVVQ